MTADTTEPETRETRLDAIQEQMANRNDGAVALIGRDDLDWLLAEVERLYSWDAIMELLDRHYPETIFPTLPDDPGRDEGPRIISLIRLLAEARAGETEGGVSATTTAAERRIRGLTREDVDAAWDRLSELCEEQELSYTTDLLVVGDGLAGLRIEVERVHTRMAGLATCLQELREVRGMSETIVEPDRAMRLAAIRGFRRDRMLEKNISTWVIEDLDFLLAEVERLTVALEKITGTPGDATCGLCEADAIARAALESET